MESACRAGRSVRARSAPAITISITQAICAAPGRLERLSQVVKIESVSVRTPRYSARADVVERLQQREREPDRERGPRQRQRHMARQHEARRAERARDLEQARALRLEHRARREEDVRIEHKRKDEDRAAAANGCSDTRSAAVGFQPVSAVSSALHRPERVEQVDIDVGDDIGREGERQRQRPGERVAAGEAIGGDEPRGADADESRSAPRHRRAAAR